MRSSGVMGSEASKTVGQERKVLDRAIKASLPAVAESKAQYRVKNWRSYGVAT